MTTACLRAPERAVMEPSRSAAATALIHEELRDVCAVISASAPLSYGNELTLRRFHAVTGR